MKTYKCQECNEEYKQNESHKCKPLFKSKIQYNNISKSYDNTVPVSKKAILDSKMDICNICYKDIPTGGSHICIPLEDITKQPHYTQYKIQPMEFIGMNKIGYIEGNIIKYVCRYNVKNGVEDLKKAKHYLDKLIEREEDERIAL